MTGLIDGMEVIDAHVHPFYCDSEHLGKVWYDEKMTLDDFAAELRRVGISRCAGSILDLGTLGDPVEWMRRMNRHAVDVKRKIGDFYLPGIQILPNLESESCREIEYYHRQHSINLIGELCPYLSGYTQYFTHEASPVWQLASDLEMVVNIHPTHDADLEKLLDNFPKLKVIAAHPGSGKNEYCARLEQMKKYPNLYLDLSGSGLFRYKLLTYGISQVGSDRFIFGTDFPICSPGMLLAGVLHENLSDEDLAKVLAGNFKRLYYQA